MKTLASAQSRLEAGLPATVLASWFGCGWAPVAPGTAGSAAALLIAALFSSRFGWRPWHFALLVAAWLVPAVWAAGRVAFSRSERDPRIVVIDEVLGQWLALAGAARLNWRSWLAAFLLFRAFDIIKPVPARQAERLAGGPGIVADDLVAGFYAALVLWLAGCFNFY